MPLHKDPDGGGDLHHGQSHRHIRQPRARRAHLEHGDYRIGEEAGQKDIRNPGTPAPHYGPASSGGRITRRIHRPQRAQIGRFGPILGEHALDLGNPLLQFRQRLARRPHAVE